MTLALDRMRELWECSPELSAKDIAEVSLSAMQTGVGGHRAVVRQAPSPRQLHQRLDAIHARMDAVLAETRPHVEGRAKLLVAADARREP